MKSLQSQLKQWCEKNGVKHSEKKNKTKRKLSEKKIELSRREIEDLMGIRRVTYKRVRGAIRRK